MSRGSSRGPRQNVRANGAGRRASGSPTPAILGGAPAFAVPLFITRPMLPDKAEFDALLGRVFESRWLTNNGEVLLELESRLRRYLQVEQCAVLCNGTIALQIALRSAVETGEVITTPFTFPATVHAIQWNGLTPVFCDIDPDTYNLDVSQAQALVSERTLRRAPGPCLRQPVRRRGPRRVYGKERARARL